MKRKKEKKYYCFTEAREKAFEVGGSEPCDCEECGKQPIELSPIGGKWRCYDCYNKELNRELFENERE